MFKLGSMFLVALIAVMALIGCDFTKDMVVDAVSGTNPDGVDAMHTMSSADDVMDMMSDADTVINDTEPAPVKLVWLINYPVGGKTDYIAWIASVASTLQAPEEVKRIASYDNVRGENPHRLVEFEFDSFVDAATYLSRPEVAEVFISLPDHTNQASMGVFIRRSDYSKDENASRQVKLVYLIDYPLGGRAAYLEWVASVAPSLQSPEEVKRLASYDNLHGVSPHRLVESEFDSIEAANTYLEQPEVQAVNIELLDRAGRVTQLLFEQRSDYTNE